MSFPKIDSPCPLRFGALPEPGRDFCTRCERRVHNLDRMSASERRAFVAACEGPVCVAYTARRLGVAVAAAGLAAALQAAPARAGDLDTNGVPAPEAAAEEPAPCPITDEVIVMGSILDPADARWLDDPASDLPELPSAPATDREAFVPAPARAIRAS